MLLKALRSGASDDEVKTARQEHETAYVAWSVERPGTLLLFRDLLSSENYQLGETGFKQSLEEKIFSPIRYCLTTALGHGDDRAAVNRTLELTYSFVWFTIRNSMVMHGDHDVRITLLRPRPCRRQSMSS